MMKKLILLFFIAIPFSPIYAKSLQDRLSNSEKQLTECVGALQDAWQWLEAMNATLSEYEQKRLTFKPKKAKSHKKQRPIILDIDEEIDEVDEDDDFEDEDYDL